MLHVSRSAPRARCQDCVNTVGQIFSNYQAALHLLEEAVPPRAGARARYAQRCCGPAEVFTPVLDACAGVAPGLEELVARASARSSAPSRRGAQPA